MPTTSSADAAMEVARDLTSALQYPHPVSPFAPVKDAQLDALRQLAEIFATHTTTPKVPSPPIHPALRVASPRLKNKCPKFPRHQWRRQRRVRRFSSAAAANARY